MRIGEGSLVEEDQKKSCSLSGSVDMEDDFIITSLHLGKQLFFWKTEISFVDFKKTMLSIQVQIQFINGCCQNTCNYSWSSSLGPGPPEVPEEKQFLNFGKSDNDSYHPLLVLHHGLATTHSARIPRHGDWWQLWCWWWLIVMVVVWWWWWWWWW